MHVPSSTADEDIEIIEVDESDLGSILADEPLFTRLAYRLSSGLDVLKEKVFSRKTAAPPPKLPPQFFTPPKPGLVTKAQPGLQKAAAGLPGAIAPIAGGTRSRVRITPQSEVPRRVRVIRRIRKPVRVSLITAEDVLVYRADIPRRKWTLAIFFLLFSAIIGGGYWLLSVRVADAQTSLDGLQGQLMTTRKDIIEGEATWETYRDLQQRLTVLNDLLNNHMMISRLFDFLEQWTLPEVSYQSAAFAPDGTLSLNVTASSYGAAARQMVAFQRSLLVKSAEAFSFTGGSEGAVTFSLKLMLDPQPLRGPLSEGDLTTSGLSPSIPGIPAAVIPAGNPDLSGSSSTTSTLP